MRNRFGLTMELFQYSVKLLQATGVLRIGTQERDVLDNARKWTGGEWQWLRDVQQRPEAALLRLQFM